MERASLKELYDNRDLIAQIFDIKNQLDKMPNTEELCKLKRQLCVFFDYLPTLVLEDKDAKIQAGYTFEQSPKCSNVLDVKDVDESTYLTKKQVLQLVNKESN